MDDEKPSPFTDLVTGAGFLALAAAIVIGAWRMDRLQHLQASIYTAPGLVPALLGAAWPKVRLADHWRLIAILALSLTYAIGFIGRGSPFWLASALYVTATVFIFQFADRRRNGTLLRGAAFAIVFGIVSGLVIHYSFQELFLVRLP